jgi:hypothetical protein
MEDNMEKFIDRVKDVLLNPKDTWSAIKTEGDNQVSIIKSYLIYLAAIPAIALFIGRVLIGTQTVLGHYRVPFFRGLLWAILYYVFTIVGIYLSALVINALASKFEVEKNELASFKLVAYSYTAPLAAGILFLVPSLENLGLLIGLYGIYLLYIGLPIIMDVQKEKIVAYTAVSSLAIIVIYWVMGGVAALVL